MKYLINIYGFNEGVFMFALNFSGNLEICNKYTYCTIYGLKLGVYICFAFIYKVIFCVLQRSKNIMLDYLSSLNTVGVLC